MLTQQGAAKVASFVAERVRDTQSVARWYDAAAPERDVTGEDLDRGDLSHGSCGTALLLAMLARHVDRGTWQPVMHAHLEAAARHFTARDNLGNIGLFTGAAGLLAVARYASNGVHYGGLLQALRTKIADHAEMTARAPIKLSYRFEMMAGLAGALIALEPEEAAAQVVERSLCELVDEALQDTSGELNVSMSHGLSGPLAALSLRGRSAHATTAARSIAAFIVEHAIRRDDELYWPGFVRGGRGDLVRVAWCYGSPGTAIALMHASQRYGLGLEDAIRRSLDTVDEIAPDRWGSDDDALCHGVAGIAACFAAAAPLGVRYAAIAARLMDGVHDRFDPSRRFGYVVRCQPYGYVESPSLLVGSSGIAIALLGAAYADDAWMRVLGLR